MDTIINNKTVAKPAYKFSILPYSQAKKNLRPLDLLLFRGVGTYSKLILELEENFNGRGIFSHVGMVVNSDILPRVTQLESNKYYVLEATTSTITSDINDSDTPDIITQGGIMGVQIRDLESVVKTYTRTNKDFSRDIPAEETAVVAVGRLLRNPWVGGEVEIGGRVLENEPVENVEKRRDKIRTKLDKIYKTYAKSKYEINCLNLLSSIVPCLRKARDDLQEIIVDEHKIFTSSSVKHGDVIIEIGEKFSTKYIYCSELICIIYKAMGILPLGINPKNSVPMDFFGFDKDVSEDGGISTSTRPLIETPISIVPDFVYNDIIDQNRSTYIEFL